MNISKTKDGEKTIFTLVGRLDTVSAPQLQSELIPEFDSTSEIELDFANLAYISSAGLRVLLMAEKTAIAEKKKLVISNISANVKEVFSMTGFDRVLKLK